MKFVINSQILFKKLQSLINVASAQKALPITQDFLLELTDDKLIITATDLETTFQTFINLTNSESNGKITIPAKPFHDFISNIPDSPVSFNIDLNKFSIDIKSSEGNYKFTGHDAEEFPDLPVIETENQFKIDSELLHDAISKTIFATGNDDLRPAICGVFCELDNNFITMVATDAHKLVKYKRSDANTNISTSFIFSKKPLNILKNIMNLYDGDVDISYGKNHICFKIGDSTIFSRLIEANYPNYEMVIPKDNKNTLIVNRNQLINSIKRLNPFANQSTQQISLTIQGQELTMEVEDIEYANQGNEKISCQYEGEDMKIAFNYKYLQEMLTNLDSNNIIFKLGSPSRAGILAPEENDNENVQIIMVLMPLLIGQN